MNKFINSSHGQNLNQNLSSSSAIPPKPPIANVPKPLSKVEPKLEIVSLTPPQIAKDSSEIKSINLNADLNDSLSPIPVPNNILQYRAIGLIYGQYVVSEEHFCKGKLITPDGTEIEAVVLGRVMPILQKKLDLEKNYLWVAYPRTIEKTSKLYVQLSGVWAPKATGKSDLDLDSNLEDGYFSIRGEILEQSISRNHVIVKIKRIDPERKLPQSRSKFKLKLRGILPNNAVGYFWDITVQRQGHSLVITSAKAIAIVPKKPPKKPVRKPELNQDRLTPIVKRPRT